jgi:hypothetical protein
MSFSFCVNFFQSKAEQLIYHTSKLETFLSVLDPEHFGVCPGVWLLKSEVQIY